MIGRIGYIVFTAMRLTVAAVAFTIKLAFGIISLFLSLFLLIFRVFLIFLLVGKSE